MHPPSTARRRRWQHVHAAVDGTVLVAELEDIRGNESLIRSLGEIRLQP